MKRRSARLSLFALYTYFTCLCAAGAQDPAGDDAPDEIYVYAYGYFERAAADVGSAATIISAERIESRQYSFVADALKEAPGLALARNSAFGGFASARLRGGSSGQTLVVIDGVIVNDPSAPQGGFNFANLDVADVEQIDVLRGPQSLIWGADAIGGVISIRTKRTGPRLSAYLEGGSQGAARGGASLFGARGGDYLRATLSGVRSDGVSRAAIGAEKDGFRSLAASLSGGVGISAAAEFSVNARIGRSHAEIDGFAPPAFDFGDTAETEDTTDYSIAARLDHRAGGFYRGALSLAYAGIDRRNEDLGIETFAASGDRLSATYWGAARIDPALSVEAGVKAERSAAEVSGVDDSAASGAVFTLVEARPFKSLLLSAGARRDEFSNFDGATTSRVAAVFKIAERDGGATRLRASWGEGFRAPTLFELNFDQFGVMPNPDLRPERARGFDFGVDHAFAPAARLSAAYFRQRVKDQIDFEFSANGYFNVARVKSEGVEVEADLALAPKVEARLVYAFIDARNALTGAPAVRTPRHSGAVTLSAEATQALRVSATLAFNGREADFPAPNKAFVRLDLRAAYAVADGLELYGRVENAADATYQDVSGFGEPGASAFAGIRVRR